MILAELEVFHSRPIAPTRRVALGERRLPTEPPPGFGSLLLGGIVAANIWDLDPDLYEELVRLTVQLEDGRRIPQPRLRHRFQTDRIGLNRSVHRLVEDGGTLAYDLEESGSRPQYLLAAVYAAGELEPQGRRAAMRAIRRSMRWHGPVGPDLVAHLSGSSRLGAWSPALADDPIRWALDTLEFELDPADAGVGGNGDRVAQVDRPGRGEVQRRFRSLVRVAHPDHGGEHDDAVDRIADLVEARRILLR